MAVAEASFKTDNDSTSFGSISFKLFTSIPSTIIKGFYDDGNIFFYNYKYGTKPCVGFAPISKKADLISKGIIKEADVIATYDIQKDIDDLYAKALR